MGLILLSHFFVHSVITLHLLFVCSRLLWVVCKRKSGAGPAISYVYSLTACSLTSHRDPRYVCFGAFVQFLAFYQLKLFSFCQSSLLSKVCMSLSWAQVSPYLQYARLRLNDCYALCSAEPEMGIVNHMQSSFSGQRQKFWGPI